MENVSLSAILSVLGSTQKFDDLQILDIVTDSREAGAGKIFVCLKGERTDGHNYAEAALAQGAELIIAERDLNLERQVVVESCMQALQDIARWYMSTLHLRKIGITGSMGKTTTKDMVLAVLSASYKVGATEGNANNELGLPKTIFSLNSSMSHAVLEMGMTAIGDIDLLCDIAPPDMGIITGIGISHIGRLGSVENILRAKLELAHALPDGSTLLLSGDDKLLNLVEFPRLNILRYGFSENCQIQCRVLEIEEAHQLVSITMGEHSCTARVPVGKHMAQNAAAAFAVGILENIPVESIAKGLESYVPSGMRQNIVKIADMCVVEDCYNASPESMRAALEALADMQCKGRKIAVLSDMLELGEQAELQHILIGEQAGRCADITLVCGDMAKHYAVGAFRAKGKSIIADNMQELAELLGSIADSGDVLWFKASRGMELERAVNSFYDIVNSRE